MKLTGEQLMAGAESLAKEHLSHYEQCPTVTVILPSRDGGWRYKSIDCYGQLNEQAVIIRALVLAALTDPLPTQRHCCVKLNCEGERSAEVCCCAECRP